MKIILSILLLFSCSCVTLAQTYSEQGLMSGSGMVLLPTMSISPSSHFYFQAARMSYFEGGPGGMNIFEINAGLSSHVEAYLKSSFEQVGKITSINAFGVGGKILLPFSIPLFEHFALWSESVSSPFDDELGFFPSNIFRHAIITDLKFVGLKPVFFGGITHITNSIKPLGGLGISLPINNSFKLGTELVYNYTGNNDIEMMLSGFVRVVSNIGINISPGYITSPKKSSWVISAGISLSTTDIDFLGSSIKKTESIVIPSIEEIEKSSAQEEKKEKP